MDLPLAAAVCGIRSIVEVRLTTYRRYNVWYQAEQCIMNLHTIILDFKWDPSCFEICTERFECTLVATKICPT